jgi:glycosyltransferase involved in cell wall biosynthesis
VRSLGGVADHGAFGLPLGSAQGMSESCEVSVVMSAYNGASSLAVTMNSILSQEGVKFEFIVVNDGSTDQTGKILDDYALRDGRVRVIHQENTGLTRALIRGCALATGEFIARQDAGDVSLPGRLVVQLDVFRNKSSVVMTSCGTRFVGPGDEVLYEVRQIGRQLHRALQHVDADRVRGPSSHTSVMFRRETFEKVGGYRAQFNVAQDLDLWMRLAEVGVCWATPEVFCENHLTKNSVSAIRRDEQMRAIKIIAQSAAARRSGCDDSALVAKWAQQRKWHRFFWGWLPRRLQEAKFYYFIGSVLRHHQPKQAQLYFWRAIRTWFPYPKAWYRILW